MTRKWLFLLIFIPLWIYSENYSIKFNHVSIEDGLSQSTVYAIQRDRKGFIWIGTEDGLNRYDGYQFKVFRREQQLSNNRITAILETEDGIIWIGTLFGLNRFDTRQNRFTSYIFNIDKAETNEITSIIKDRRGILWVGTDKGIYLLKPGSDQFETTLHQQPITPLLTSSNILKLYEDNSGYV